MISRWTSSCRVWPVKEESGRCPKFWAAGGQVTEDTDVFHSEGSDRYATSDCCFIRVFASSHVEHLREIYLILMKISPEMVSVRESIYNLEEETLFHEFWRKL